jgi:signal transduction histidine kinase
VLAQTSQGGALVPLAVHGTRRVPWRTPLTEPGPLQRAWQTQQPVVDRRPTDKHGRRRGNALAVFPLASGSGPFGLLILESLEPEAFPDSVLAAVVDRVRETTLRLETALLFSEVRASASMEERDRLAREMHDGVAQDLAFLGYRLDELRGQAAKVDEQLASAVADLRSEVTELIANLRLSITDLKTSVSADRGLGSALSSYVRAVGSGQQLTVHLSLQESPFRLPADQEVALFRVAQAVAQDVRRSGRAGNLWVTLSVDPPSARLLVEHDGPIGQGSPNGLGLVSDDLTRVGGRLEVRDRRGGGVRVEAVLEGTDDGAGPAGRRPRADPAGTPSSVRGD